MARTRAEVKDATFHLRYGANPEMSKQGWKILEDFDRDERIAQVKEDLNDLLS